MESMTTFDSTKESLLDLLQSIKQGKTQLPDFQRGWVWDDDHIRSLLASVSLSFPIGAVMMLQTGNPDVRFKPRLVEGLNLARPARARTTHPRRPAATHLAVPGPALRFTGGDADRRDNAIKRWYYLDIAKALSPNGDREDAIVGIPEDRQIRNFRSEVIADYSTTEKECAADLLPLPLVFDTAGLTDWQMNLPAVRPGPHGGASEPLEPVAGVRDPALPAVPDPPHPHAEADAQGGCLPGLREGQHRRRFADRLRAAHGDLCRRRVQSARGLGCAAQAAQEAQGPRGNREHATSSRR